MFDRIGLLEAEEKRKKKALKTNSIFPFLLWP